ncbi:hypothetical protein BpHYR1_039995 [Brachionus plicatilis]|uniref:Uncharacterized protein n=1 Tax=Brachionus plicatilis TaxID=10195 RepID=A0A3M7SIJ4_BRAPC|nr:hypothetical protein BpHYR1_039995 [Brachionus plicatilis]
MNIPLERKRRPGRPKASVNALTRQSNETQNVNVFCISVSEGSDSGDPPISKKIRLEETLTVTPQPQVKKKRGRPVGSNKQKKKNKKIHLFLSSVVKFGTKLAAELSSDKYLFEY